MAVSLDERAEVARIALHERFDELNALWRKAEAQLAEFNVPRGVRHYCEEFEDHPCQPPGCWYLVLHRINGKWRICYGTEMYCCDSDDDNWDVNPITDCSVEIRRHAVKYLRDFQESVVKSIEDYVSELDESLSEFRRIVNHDTISHLLAERAKLNGKAK